MPRSDERKDKKRSAKRMLDAVYSRKESVDERERRRRRRSAVMFVPGPDPSI